MRDKVYVFVNLHIIDILVYQHIKPPLPPSLKYSTVDITHTEVPYLIYGCRTTVYTDWRWYDFNDDDKANVNTYRNISVCLGMDCIYF